jgi:site-specific recombinase XerD
MATLDAYDKDWRALARWYAETTDQSFDMVSLTAMDAVDYSSFLARTTKPATVTRRLLFLRTYTAAAFRAHEVSEALNNKIQELRAPKAQLGAPKSLTAEEARLALRNVERDGTVRDKAILFAFFMTGIRVGELAGLEVRDLTIGERSGEVRVRSAVAKGGRERTVPLAKEVRDYLQEYLAKRQDGSPALFVGQRGQMTPDGIRDVVAKLAGVSPHRLRHTFAYEYLRTNENDLVALAEILGHASLNTTRLYTRRRREDLEEGLSRVRYAKKTAE